MLIEEGDMVNVHFTNETWADLIVLHVPCDDNLWYLRSRSGEIIALNRMSSNLSYIVKPAKQIKIKRKS